MELSSHLTEENLADADEKHFQDAKSAFQSHNLGDTMSQGLSRKDVEDKIELKQAKGLDTIPETKNDPLDDDAKDSEALESFHNFSTRRCTLTCCAPDGSPLQGKSFIIDRVGATIGRKHTNAIPLFMKVRRP